MIRNGKGCAYAVLIFPYHHDVISFPNQPKAKLFQSAYAFILWGRPREISSSNGHFGLGDECLDHGLIRIDSSMPKVSIWNLMADFTSSKADSWESPCPITNPFNPRG
jgi:hypothetical protein